MGIQWSTLFNNDAIVTCPVSHSTLHTWSWAKLWNHPTYCIAGCAQSIYTYKTWILSLSLSVHAFRSHQKSHFHEIWDLGPFWSNIKHDEARFFFNFSFLRIPGAFPELFSGQNQLFFGHSNLGHENLALCLFLIPSSMTFSRGGVENCQIWRQLIYGWPLNSQIQ